MDHPPIKHVDSKSSTSSGRDESEMKWCDKQEQLLLNWAEKAAGYRWLHNHARVHYNRQNNRLSYPSIIISSITGVGGFAVLNPSGSDDLSSSSKMNIMIAQYLFAFLNVIAGILTSILKFSGSNTLAGRHSLACVQYSKFYRNVEMELSLQREHRQNVGEFFQKCRYEYDRLLDDSPDLPNVSIVAFNVEFPAKENKPDVCNGLNVLVSIGDDCSRSEGGKITKSVSKWLGATIGKISSRKALVRSGSGSLDEGLSNSPKINTSKDSSPV